MSTGSPATAPPVPVLYFAALPQLHPANNIGVSLLHSFAPNAAVRLAGAATTASRTISVSWRPRDGRRSEEARTCILDWSGCLGVWSNSPDTITAAVPEQDRTEYAAIAVMALLVHHLEGAEVVGTLAIGSGGDYNLLVKKKTRFQVEVSGIEVDLLGHETRKRVRKKSAQVLKRRKKGFVSVTTFDHQAQGVLSHLRFVWK